MKLRQVQFAFVTSLTLGRIPLILIFLLVNVCMARQVDGEWLLGRPTTHSYWFGLAFCAMVLSALTDLFDGYFARRFDMVTKLGAYADPLTDKIFYVVTFPTLVYWACLKGEVFHGGLLLGLTIVFMVRDQWVSFLRSIGAMYNVDAKANWSGKARTVISFPAICCIYWYLTAPGDWLLQLPKWSIYATEVVSLGINLISIWVYTRYYWPWVKKEMKTG